MSVARSTGNMNKKYLYYRCENRTCPRSPKSIRGGMVAEAVANEMNILTHLTGEAYEQYLKEVKDVTGNKKLSARSEISRLHVTIRGLNNKRDSLTVSLAKLTDARTIENINHQLSDISLDIEQLEQKLASNK